MLVCKLLLLFFLFREAESLSLKIEKTSGCDKHFFTTQFRNGWASDDRQGAKLFCSYGNFGVVAKKWQLERRNYWLKNQKLGQHSRRVIRQHTIESFKNSSTRCSSLFGFSHFRFLYPNALFLSSPSRRKIDSIEKGIKKILFTCSPG